MKNHTQESLEEARLQGVWDRQDRKAIQDHYGDDVELYAAYLDGYDPNGEIVKKVNPIDPVENSEKVWWDDTTKTWISIDEAVAKANCPNCADQASIAAPGQTTLCKTHEDEKHFREMKEFFVEECERLIFKPALPFCSCCGTEKTVVYVGIIISVTGHPLTFSFCVDCRDELTLKQNAARAAQERIGA